MVARLSRFPSSSPTRSGQLAFLLAAVWLTCSAGLLPAQTAGGSAPVPTLHKVREVEMAFNSHFDGRSGVEITSRQKHSIIRFTKGERFEFYLPQEFAQPSSHQFFGKGFTVHTYDGGRQFLLISNRLLMYRQALLAAEKYFDQAARNAGLQFRFMRAGPIRIIVGKPTEPAAAQASFQNNWICFNSDGYLEQNVPVHEYFHFLSYAVWYQDASHYARILGRAQEPFRVFLREMTADWATDEPITIAASPGYPAMNLDLLQSFLRYNGDLLIQEGDRGFFNPSFSSETLRRIYPPRQYQANVLIKYWAEQMAGRQDQSGAAELLRALNDIESDVGANAEGFFPGLARPLAARFDAPDDEHRWREFFRCFCASNVVQRADLNTERNSPIGYRDEAFAKQFVVNDVAGRLKQASRVGFDKVWLRPAETDQERRERLKTLAGNADEIEALAQALYLIDVDNRYAPPRPVFFYAKGDPGTELFLLRQRRRWRNPKGRADGTFALVPDATFADQPDSDPLEKLTVVEGIDFQNGGDYLWLGLVNAATELKPRQATWAYLASPRLMRNSSPQDPGDTQTVKLVGGAADQRDNRWRPRVRFFNGDDFVLKVESSGALHHRSADVNDLRTPDTALDVRILDANDNVVPLDIDNGRELTIRGVPNPRSPHSWQYFISGRIPEANDYVGHCRFRIRLSSPLNLGPPDEQIDETYEFDLIPSNPYLERLEVLQGDRVAYDSLSEVRAPLKAEDGDFRMIVKARFSRDMDPNRTQLTAGGTDPFDRYPVEPLVWQSKRILRGRLVIPQSDVPASGMVLRFSASGVTLDDADTPTGHIDDDLFKDGLQPDTSHFLILGVRQYWEVTRTGSSRKTVQDVHKNMHLLGDWGPIRERTRLVNANHDLELDRGTPNPYADQAVGVLQGLERNIERARNSIKELAADVKAAEAPGSGQSRDVIAFRRAALLRQRQRLGFMTLRLRPLVEAVVRLNHGYRWLGWRQDLSGPIAVSYAGMHCDWVEREFRIPRPGRLLGEPIFLPDAASHLQASPRDTDMLDSGVYVWNFWPSDLRKAQQLIDLTFHLPDYVTQAEPTGPQSLDSDAARELVQSVLHYFIQENITLLGHQLSANLWSFVPVAEWPFPATLFEDSGAWKETKNDWRQLPSPSTDRLLRIHYGQTIPDLELPFRYEKRQRYAMPSRREPGESHETGTDRETTLVWWPIGDSDTQYQRIDRETRKNVWLDEQVCPPLPGFYDHPVGYFPGYSRDNYEKSIRWSILNRNCLTRLNFAGPESKNLSLMLQPESDSAEIELRGVVQTWQYDGQPGHYYSQEWDIAWSIRRVGDPLPADPDEPLPEWDQALGDPPSLGPPGTEPAADPDRPSPEPASSPDSGSGKNDGKPEPKDWDSIEATSFDPVTGLTTEAKKNPDGSRTITTFDSQGKVRSQETVTEADRRRSYGSQYDPDTGETTTVVGNDDGSRTTTVTDRDGNVKSKKTVSEEDRNRPWASSRNPQTGETTTSERLPDGRVRITTRDADENLIGEPVFRPEK